MTNVSVPGLLHKFRLAHINVSFTPTGADVLVRAKTPPSNGWCGRPRPCQNLPISQRGRPRPCQNLPISQRGRPRPCQNTLINWRRRPRPCQNTSFKRLARTSSSVPKHPHQLARTSRPCQNIHQTAGADVSSVPKHPHQLARTSSSVPKPPHQLARTSSSVPTYLLLYLSFSNKKQRFST